MKFRVLLFLLLSVISSINLFAQLPSNLQNAKASQISDDQLLTIIKKAESSGQSQESIINDLKARGLPDSEISELLGRMNGLSRQASLSEMDNAPTAASRAVKKGTLLSKTTGKIPDEKSLVFGSELFSESSPLFIPDLNIATPENYSVGPGDELLLEVFGANVFSQKIVVSREGFINVKYAGIIAANGVAIQELREQLKAKLSKFIPALASGSSRLQLSLSAIRSITVTVVGAVKKPGTITIPSLATLFNALYTTGGPLENGSLRNIELIRGNKKILEADLYDFLLKGDQSANVFLRDNDLIRVPFAQLQVQLSGLLNRPGIFEAKSTEHLSDLLAFAGGFKPMAYQGRITGTRNGVMKKEIIDVAASDLARFSLRHGDSLYVDSLIDKFSNRITIKGAVYKPGIYAWTPGQQLLDIINKAAGLKADAFMGRAIVLRTYDNLQKENISVNLQDLFNGKIGFELQNEDSVTIFSTYDLKEKKLVKIFGAIQNPGEFSFADSLTLQQLILIAGGFKDNAIPTGIEIGRIRMDDTATSGEEIKVNLLDVAISPDLQKTGSDVLLQPGDIITIKSDPYKIPQTKVLLSGKVFYPGTYVLKSSEDRLSDIIKRAGGLLSSADINGIKIIRKNLSQDTSIIKKTLEKQDKSKEDTLGATSQAQKLAVTEVAVDLGSILKYPGSDKDIILEDGDEIVFPQIKNVVTVTGEVFKPVALQFRPGGGFKYYISSAGGFASKAKRSKSFAIYSSGRSKRTATILGVIRIYPRLTPGSTIVVPSKPVREGKFDAAKAGILISSLSAIATTIAVLKGL